MITYQKYFQNITHLKEEKPEKGLIRDYSEINTILEAELRFRDEIAPKDRKNIINRLCGKVYGRNQEPGMLSEYPLNDYLSRVEKIVYNQLNEKYFDANSDKARKISIKKRIFKFGLDIKIVSPHDIQSNEMLNLEDLDTFILTGKSPQKK